MEALNTKFDYEIQLFISKMYPIEQPYNLSVDEKEIIERKHSIFESLLTDFSLEEGEEQSLKERETISVLPDITLTYGEIDFVSMSEIYYTILHRYGGLPSGIFYDLGSGVGKCVIASAFLCSFSKCKGIEILSSLYQISQSVKTAYDLEITNILEANQKLFVGFPEVEFINSDMFLCDWKDAGLLFANSTCFGQNMMQKIGCIPLAVGTIGVSFTEIFIGDGWIVLESIRKNMSWGQATVYIQRYVGSSNINRIKGKQ